MSPAARVLPGPRRTEKSRATGEGAGSALRRLRTGEVQKSAFTIESWTHLLISLRAVGNLL